MSRRRAGRFVRGRWGVGFGPVRRRGRGGRLVTGFGGGLRVRRGGRGGLVRRGGRLLVTGLLLSRLRVQLRDRGAGLVTGLCVWLRRVRRRLRGLVGPGTGGLVTGRRALRVLRRGGLVSRSGARLVTGERAGFVRGRRRGLLVRSGRRGLISSGGLVSAGGPGRVSGRVRSGFLVTAEISRVSRGNGRRGGRRSVTGKRFGFIALWTGRREGDDERDK